MKWLIAVMIIAVLLVAGCTQASQTQPSQTKANQSKPIPSTNVTNLTNQSNLTACNPPQIKNGTSCCLDSNGNGKCDSSEDMKCWNTTCEFYCLNSTLHYGRCVNGTCQYSSMVCPDACVDGRCMSFNPMYLNKSFVIDANWTAGSYSIFVDFTNTGINSIDMMEAAVYLDGRYVSISSGNTGLLASGDSKTLNITLNKTIVKVATCPTTIFVTLSSGLSRSGTVRCFGKGYSKVIVTNPWSVFASNGAMQLNVTNNLAGDINVTGAKFGTYAYNASNVSQMLAPGEWAVVQFVTNKWPGPTKTKAGSSYSMAVTVLYNYNGSALSSVGTLSGIYF